MNSMESQIKAFAKIILKKDVYVFTIISYSTLRIVSKDGHYSFSMEIHKLFQCKSKIQ